MSGMISFKQALRRHALLKDALAKMQAAGFTEAQAEDLASSIWSGVTSAGKTDIASQAVADTTPGKWATLLATDDIAAAFAVACLLPFLSIHGPFAMGQQSPHAVRALALEGWEDWTALAEQAGHLQHGTGADMSAAWPTLMSITLRPVDADKIRRIADLAGRMFAVLKGIRASKVTGVPEEVVGTELGGSFGSLVQSEYARLGNVALRRELLLRVAQRQAVQVRREGRQPTGRGPLVIALDESGSMSDEPNIWAKSVMSALVRIAWEDNRPCVCVHFSTCTRVTRLNPGDQRALLKAQGMFLDGGTEIGTALDVALDEVDALAKAGVPGADVVLVSDGGDSGSGVRRAIDRMDRQKVRLWGVAIGTEWRGDLRKRSAEYLHVQGGDLDDAKSIEALAKAVAPGVAA